VRPNVWLGWEAGVSRSNEHFVFPAIERAPWSSSKEQRVSCSWHVEMLHLLQQLTTAASDRDRDRRNQVIRNNSRSTPHSTTVPPYFNINQLTRNSSDVFHFRGT
jgi:hypothetical protein